MPTRRLFQTKRDRTTFQTECIVDFYFVRREQEERKRENYKGIHWTTREKERETHTTNASGACVRSTYWISHVDEYKILGTFR